MRENNNDKKSNKKGKFINFVQV